MSGYVYIPASHPDDRLWIAGFYRPNGTWEPESDHDTSDAAAKRVHYLNGGSDHAAEDT